MLDRVDYFPKHAVHLRVLTYNKRDLGQVVALGWWSRVPPAAASLQVYEVHQVNEVYHVNEVH